MVVGSNPVAVTLTSDIAPFLSKEFLDIQATIECRFTLKHVCDMIITYIQWLYSILLLLGGHIKGNPGPKQSSISAFSICHWNLSSIFVYNYAKTFLLKAYILILILT